MWGPATNPTTPPATKPTGPPTRAPEAAPSAPSNTRSPAPAAVGANSAAATNADAMTCLMIFLPVGGHTIYPHPPWMTDVGCQRAESERASSDSRRLSSDFSAPSAERMFTAPLRSPYQAPAGTPQAPPAPA